MVPAQFPSIYSCNSMYFNRPFSIDAEARKALVRKKTWKVSPATCSGATGCPDASCSPHARPAESTVARGKSHFSQGPWLCEAERQGPDGSMSLKASNRFGKSSTFSSTSSFLLCNSRDCFLIFRRACLSLFLGGGGGFFRKCYPSLKQDRGTQNRCS